MKSLSNKLVTAATEGDLDKIKELVQSGTNVHEHLGEPLRWAGRNGRLDIVKYLVEQGTGTHVTEAKEEVLEIASIYGYTHIVKYLVEQGICVHFKDDMALNLADLNSEYDTVEYILSLQPKIYWLTHQNRRTREIYKRYTRGCINESTR